MKKLIFVLVAFCAFSIVLSGCAKEKDGSVTFWNDSASSIGIVVVTMADGTSGNITSDYSSDPGCSAAACFTYTNSPGSYNYNAIEASPGTKTWSGSATITDDGCLTIRLY